jgi:hypothetical protein
MSQGCPNIYVYIYMYTAVIFSFDNHILKYLRTGLQRFHVIEREDRHQVFILLGLTSQKQTRDVAFGYHYVGLGEALIAVHKRPVRYA